EVYNFFDKKFTASKQAAAQSILAQNNVPLPARKPDVAAAQAGGRHQSPVFLNRSAVFMREPESKTASIASLLSQDRTVQMRDLDDYRSGANQIPAAHRLLPPVQAPMSIADLLMLS